MTALVGPETRDDDIDVLRARLSEREAVLGERDAEVARVRSDLGAFQVRYRQTVGTLHEQLDGLELEIAEAELGVSPMPRGSAADDPTGPAPGDRPPPPPRYTSDAVRKLFRDVAKAVHPDLAHDEVARDRRHDLMVEANRAYALGDEERLRLILHVWEKSPEAVQGDDAEAIRLRLLRRIGRIEEQLDTLASELADLMSSPLGQLKSMVDEAAAKGKDLVEDMVKRLKRDIMVATNRRDAIRPPDRHENRPRGENRPATSRPGHPVSDE